MANLHLYTELLAGIKMRIRQGQYRVSATANAELLKTYWDIGRMIHERQLQEGWGANIIEKIADDLRNEISEIKGFSARNLKQMIQFFREYPTMLPIVQPPVAQLENAAVSDNDDDETIELNIELDGRIIMNNNTIQFVDDFDVPESFYKVNWSQHIILIQKVKELKTRYWYMQKSVEGGWTKDALVDMIKSNLHERQGALVNNFASTMTSEQHSLANEIFKDPYIFDFMTLSAPFTERELELEMVKNVEKFLVELGAGFAFVGRQYKLVVSDRDFYLDLLFYHLKMRCFVVIELKKGEFKPEFAGKMNFYCSAVDDLLKHHTDQPTVGLILCQEKDRVFAEYSLKDIHKPIGISDYELTRLLPDKFKGSLPSIEEIEIELSQYTSSK